MMLERHYDEEDLIAILHSGDERSRDPHLKSCTACADTLDSYRVMVDVLGEEVVWNRHEPKQEEAARGAAAVRAFASTMENEDARAGQLVDELLKLPRQWWVSTVTRDERFHLAGVVRRLVEVSDTRLSTMQLDAVEIAAVAVAVANVLHDSQGALQLRGSAYRQHGYVLMHVGEFSRALISVERAQAIFEQCTVSDYELARLDLVRSLIYSRQQRFDEALKLSRSAARAFQACGDTQRVVSARLSEAYLLIQAQSLREALALLLTLQQQFGSVVDLPTRALLLNNIGGCQWNLGHIADALPSLQLSAELYAELGNETESARVGYNVALLLAAHGRRADAKKRLDTVRDEFERLGMAHMAAVAGLDLAEIALLENNFKEVEDLCRAAIRQFERAGIAQLSEALTALTYLREAAEQRRATQETVWHVRTYIKRLPDEPALLFAPAPLPPA